ncbi:hypothetical protein BDV59DRAFT_62330 [Aspergillus ambiguus]|uniref:uncharacterized protein n=1 Tax=Aspergillus ambiguus TaxID=176160 RepID=UPI003CCDD421
MPPTKAYILVYEGTPLDFSEYRHTALHFVYAASTAPSTTTMHVVGTQGLFEFQEDVDQDPHDGGDLARMIPVGDIPGSVSAAAIKKTVSATPVKNGRADLDWNCQNWVGDALAQMVESGFFTDAQRALAIDLMLDVCLEAKDG